ncbi:hypothetical protein SmJEL517_g01368 [Synchytrium microbalum]|uniref:Multiple inositol polyphosphate phosphatase 1 n=1 Tax=Synchytrium microbalum TaxID=1806994 RepID=A0A507CGM0_9FUNG|nr:uncharacterized protein SmJEL517_g01368 [Synchytrium microbalum]TPX36663.1 hypothetical protein SmJEL517_g01368 [Synchytrium microbalum]
MTEDNVTVHGSSFSEESFIEHTLGSRRKYPEPVSQVQDAPARCELQQIQLVTRHGTRYPTFDWYSKFRQLESHFEKHHEVLKKRHPYLAAWRMPFDDEMEGQLTESGLEEMRRMAIRLKKRNPTFFASLKPMDVVARSSNKSRTLNSADAFIKGLYDGNHTCHVEVLDRKRDADLVPWESCKRYRRVHDSRTPSIDSQTPISANLKHAIDQKEIDMERPRKGEYAKYIDEQLPRIVKSTSKRLGIPLTTEHVLNMLEMCGQEVTIFNMFDGFCTIFERHEFLVRETAEDIERYYSFGYGFDINLDMMCSLVTDLLESAKHAEEYPLLLRFTHAEAMAPLAAALGFFKDPPPPLSHSHRPLSRAWRSSFIAPYAANLKLETYKCHHHDVVRPYVRILWNERNRFPKLKIPGCESKGLCPLDSVLHVYGKYMHCDFDAMCGNEKPSSGGWNRWK